MMRFGFRTMRRGSLGRLDPKTGSTREWPFPADLSPNLWNYVLDDIVWYSESGVRPNTLVRFDPGREIPDLDHTSGGGVVRT